MLRQRAVGAAVLVPVVAVVFVLGQPWLTGLVALLAFFAAREVFTLLGHAGYRSLRRLGSAVAVGLVVVSALLPRHGEAVALVGGAALVVTAIGGLLRENPKEGFEVWMVTAFGGLYAGLLAFLVLIVELAPPLGSGAPLERLGAGRAWLLVLVLGVWAMDTGAYLVGRRFGRRRIVPRISPGKTWEGLAGGLAAATLLTGLTLWAAGEQALMALVLGPLIGISGQLGDLVESMLKRASGAVASGLLIPGHGGVLDRVDSFLVAGPVAFLYLVILGGAR